MLRQGGSSRSTARSQLAALVAIALAVHLWGACSTASFGDENAEAPGPDAGPGADATAPGGDDNSVGDTTSAGACGAMDILFVIDDSLSMGEEQANLAANFPGFIDILEQRQGGDGQPLDYRVAVTTTGRSVNFIVDYPIGFLPVIDIGGDGAFQNDPECGLPRPWLERGDPDVAAAFACQAEVGILGSNLEMPLLATELALVDRVADGTNAGFLRPDALLAIVIVTDEDDCSRRDNNFVIGSLFSDICDSDPGFDAVQHYIDVLDTIKGGRERWATAVIAGPGPGICVSPFGDSFEGHRLRRFVSDVGDNALFSSICQGDLASALADTLDTFGAACDGLPPIQ